ncbi:putative toxin-antitoxin system toxin component, PIN family [Parapedobacter sp. 10938]|uniref:putative toxin-antitoxin system toxin component, PIN family n=1 Tax=Parapedobacter flavus TaxID=3110225 RepID=UPI002DBA0BBA|nr:putative toxin-antitoxin system toxin component, PIN family [Parapedobacter sp. 10938]MEC3880706.1 putative toxin-antitoxin system toxin component, PIN family [Parapedobacter sp. 10938]
MKVVIDVNILLQSLGKSSRFRPIWAAYIAERFNLLVSNSILMEYEEMLAQKTSETVALNVISLIGEAVNTRKTNIFYEWNVIQKDPDDNKYFDTAVSGDADYLVTNDKHFNEVKALEFPVSKSSAEKTF